MPFLLAVLLFGSVNPSVLTVPPPDYTSTSTVKAYVASQDSKVALFVAEHESGFVWNERGDLTIKCRNTRSPFYGKPVTARGVWQITRCYHPEVTDEQADDVEWSTMWALPRLADYKTCIKEWTQCAVYYK